MRLNIHILYDELKNYSPDIRTKRNNELNLINVELLTDSRMNLTEEYIYIVEADTFNKWKNPPKGIDMIVVGAVNPDCLNENCSLILISGDYNAEEIINEVLKIFMKYNNWENKTLHLIIMHHSIQEIADHAVEILYNPICFFDIGLALICISGTISDSHDKLFWEYLTKYRHFPSEFLTAKDYEYMNSLTAMPLLIPTPYKNKMSNVFNVKNAIGATIRLNNNNYIYLLSTDSLSNFTIGQISLFKKVRDLIELKFLSDTQTEHVGSDDFYYMIQLINGMSINEDIIDFYLKSKGWSMQDNFLLYTIAAKDGHKFIINELQTYITQLKRLKYDSIIFPYEDDIILIIRNSPYAIHQTFEDILIPFLNKFNLCSGKSQAFNHFSDIRCFFIQSKLAIEVGIIFDEENTLYPFNKYYFSIILRLLRDSIDLKSICHPNILKLKRLDAENNTDHVKCLQTYIANGCNISKTAKDMFMHRSTLVYHLEKISDLIDFDVSELNEEERLQIWFSCRICQNVI